MSFSVVLFSHMQPFCRACGVGGTTLSMCAFMQRELDFMPWACVRHARMRNPSFGPRQERFRVNAANALSTKLARSRWSLSLCFFVTRKKGK